MKPYHVLRASVAVSLISLSSAVSAADVRGKGLPPVTPPKPTPVRDWSGAYIGVNGGFFGTGVNSKSAAPNIPALNFTNPVLGTNVAARNRNRTNRTLNGFGGGIQAGYNFQSGNIVYGVEAEGAIVGNGGKNATTNLKAEQTFQGALKGRLGYSFGSTLVYATAGVAVAPITYSSPAIVATSTTRAVVAGKKSVTSVGPLVGVGVEQKLTEQISVKGEVEFASFGSTTLNLPAGRTTVESSQLSAKIGLNYRF